MVREAGVKHIQTWLGGQFLWYLLPILSYQVQLRTLLGSTVLAECTITNTCTAQTTTDCRRIVYKHTHACYMYAFTSCWVTIKWLFYDDWLDHSMVKRCRCTCITQMNTQCIWTCTSIVCFNFLQFRHDNGYSCEEQGQIHVYNWLSTYIHTCIYMHISRTTCTCMRTWTIRRIHGYHTVLAMYEIPILSST